MRFLRLFEELVNWNYVDVKRDGRQYGDLPYRVTEKGWQELERKLNRRTVDGERATNE